MQDKINNSISYRKAITHESTHLKTTLTNQYIHAATSDNTRKAYRSDIQHFITWGGLLPTTTEMVIQYLHYHATSLNPRTLARRLISIRQWHTLQGYTDPTVNHLVSKTLKGIKRTHGNPKRKTPGLLFEQLHFMSNHLTQHTSLRNLRNNALLLLQFAGALRVSELLAINIEHLYFNNEGLSILIPKSKTDQENEGKAIFIPYSKKSLCPVSALRSWIEASGLKGGVVFRSINNSGLIQEKELTVRTVNNIIQSTATACNLHTENKHYSSHSLRRGFATEASRKKASIASIMRQGRWRSMRTVMEYIEEGQRLEDNAANAIFNS
jgi:site-specific recombinase XerD